MDTNSLEGVIDDIVEEITQEYPFASPVGGQTPNGSWHIPKDTLPQRVVQRTANPMQNLYAQEKEVKK